jgi:hypothetical protein
LKGIETASQAWNFDESGVIVENPKGDSVIVPINIKEVHGLRPTSQKSVTIIEAICTDGRDLPPPAVILLGKVFIES